MECLPLLQGETCYSFFILRLIKSGPDSERNVQNSFLLQTVVSNPGYMKDNFYITIETFHIADRGQQENVHELDKKALKERQVTFPNSCKYTCVLGCSTKTCFFPNKVPPTTHLPYYLCIFIFLTSFQVVPIDIANDAVTTADYKVYLQRKLRNKEKNYKSNEKM